MSLRDLMAAAEGAWEPHAEMLAMVGNVNRDRKKRASPYSGREFNPFTPAHQRVAAKRGIPIGAGTIHLLKALVPKRKGTRNGGQDNV